MSKDSYIHKALPGSPGGPLLFTFHGTGGGESQFPGLARELLPAEPWDEQTWAGWTSALKQETGRKGKSLFLPLRLALTGKGEGPELKTLLPVLGRKVSAARLS